MPGKIKTRRKSIANNYDPNSVDSNSYNDAAGGRKITDVGHHLKPIDLGSGYTTDASTRRKIGKGIAVAVFNGGAAVATVTMGNDSVLTLAPGITDANGSVGIPVAVGAWIYLNTYTHSNIVTSAATLYTYIIEDDTNITVNP